MDSFLGSPDDVNDGVVSDEYIAAVTGTGFKKAPIDAVTAEAANIMLCNTARRDRVIVGLAIVPGKQTESGEETVV